jgi:hypothetical protein
MPALPLRCSVQSLMKISAISLIQQLRNSIFLIGAPPILGYCSGRLYLHAVTPSQQEQYEWQQQ